MENKTFKYNCKKCDYHNNNLSNFRKHLSTAKHNSEKLSNKKVNKSGDKMYVCEKCGKEYKVRNSLWYHKKKCKASFVSSNNHLEKENADLKQMIFEVMDKMSQQNKVIQELAPKVGNNNNNQGGGLFGNSAAHANQYAGRMLLASDDDKITMHVEIRDAQLPSKFGW